MATVYKLEGAIDSFNAKEFEDKILAFQKEHGELILDASDLEYMSSSGIRVLVKLSRLQGEVRIDNVNDSMFSIFYSAGLTEIFKINREMLELKNDGWEVVGNGASGTVYKINNDTAVKVYNEGTRFEYVNQERELARQAFISGVPTIIPDRNAKVDGRYATIFELVNSSSLGEELSGNPDRFEDLMDQYVAMVKDLHSIEDRKGFFPNLQDLWLQSEHMIREGMPKEDADFIIDVYKNSKRSSNLLHGDIHPGNVMISGGEMVLVDMASMSTGPALLDLITVYRLPMFGKDIGLLEAAESSMGIPQSMFEPFWDSFARRYFETDDKAVLDKIKDDLYGVTALDLMFSINTIPPENARNFYRIVGENIMENAIRPNKDKIRKIFEEGKLDY
ncbi:MAG: phosphotransferase [Lachnospiraceae bacterium]|nr:phosphotransferase [Lachnospiraceae bacterium]